MHELKKLAVTEVGEAEMRSGIEADATLTSSQGGSVHCLACPWALAGIVQSDGPSGSDRLLPAGEGENGQFSFLRQVRRIRFVSYSFCICPVRQRLCCWC